MKNNLSFSCDVDGIFNNYPHCWLDYLCLRCGTRYSTVDEAKRNESLYRKYKDEYRNSDYKASLPINIHNRDVVNLFTTKCELTIVTSRPILDDKYPNLFLNTKNWLIRNNINFSNYTFKDNQASFIDTIPGLLFHIDDDPQYAKIVASKGIKVYLLYNENWDFSSVDSEDNIIVIKDLTDILKHEPIF